MRPTKTGLRLRRCRLLAPAVVTALGCGSVTAVAAVHATYLQVDPGGPPKAWGKGAGDLDGDGLADLVVGSGAGGVYWYKNPQVSRPKRTISSSFVAGEELDVVDLDQDGDNDVIVTYPGGAVWFANGGGGTAWTQHPLAAGAGSHDVEVVDVDGDGKLDVVLRGKYPSGDTLTILRQLTPTTWSQSAVDLPEGGTGLVMADLDRDAAHRPDAAVGKYWLRNTSTPGRIAFSAPFTYSSVAEQDTQITAGDINGDGRLDLFVTAAHPKIAGGGKNAWYAQPGDPTMRWRETVLERFAQRAFHAAVIVDLDGDGDLDLATAMSERATDPKLKAYINNGRGVPMTTVIMADAALHGMTTLRWGGKLSLFGAVFNYKPTTPIGIWQVSP